VVAASTAFLANLPALASDSDWFETEDGTWYCSLLVPEEPVLTSTLRASVSALDSDWFETGRHLALQLSSTLRACSY
jgi:hypothetical protein